MLRLGFILLCLLLAGCQESDKENRNSGPQASPTVNEMNSEQTQGSLNLWAAAERGDLEEIRRGIEDGASINAQDEQGNTPAMVAVLHNRAAAFTLLSELGADINIRNQRSDNPLLYAGAEGLLDIVRIAVKHGADTTLTNRFGGTALIPAADRGHVDIVKELLETSDVNINHINNLGWTALLEAVILGDGGTRHQEIVNLLIKHGADVNIPDSSGITPLQHAKRSGYTAMIESLEAAGAQ